MSQAALLRLQWLLMGVSSIGAFWVLVHVRWACVAASHILNLYNRGHDFQNVMFLLIGTLAYDSLIA